MYDKITVAAAFTVLAIVLASAGILIFKVRKASTSLDWSKLKKKDKVTSMYISALLVVLIIAWIICYLLISS
jgi:H+/Cl- antiporter ClcA